MIKELLGGEHFLRYSQCNNDYKGLYSWVKAHLCSMVDQGIRVCLGPNKNGLPKEQTLSYRRASKIDIMTERANSKHHPLSKKGLHRSPIRPSFISSIVAAPHLFIVTLPSQENKIPSLSCNRGPLIGHFRMRQGTLQMSILSSMVISNL